MLSAITTRSVASFATDATLEPSSLRATVAPPPPVCTVAVAAAEPAAAAGPPQPDIHLVTRLRIVEKAEGTHMLQISDSATTLNVPLNRDQIIQFTKGILTVLERCEWGLDWDAETGEQPADSAAAGVSDDAIDITADSPSRYRH